MNDMTVTFDDISIGRNNSVFIVAELSANHLHDFDIALKTVKAMHESGADAVKLQTYTPDTLTIDVDNEFFRIGQGSLWQGETLYSLYEKAYTPWEWQPKIKEFAEELGLVCFSTPFDPSAVDFLENMKMQVYKVASFEIFDIPLIEYIASKGKPIMISTGMASLADIEEALEACRREGNDHIVLLKCTSSYPAPIDQANLRTIHNMAETFGTEVGLSDHTMGNSVALAAVALGASVVEKHFILDRKMGGPDSSFSMEPFEFKQMVASIREVEKSIGEVSYVLSEGVVQNKIFARSIFTVKDIKAGETFNEENIRSIRPGYGLHPKFLPEIIGKKARIDIEMGTPVLWKDIS